jgi:phosphate:Na+ symporter
VLALVGVIFYMTAKNSKRKDTGTILLGFATLMFGMETMSGAVAGLKVFPRLLTSWWCSSIPCWAWRQARC